MGAAAKKTGDLNHLLLDIATQVSQVTGNQVSEKHLPMIENRLRKRIMELSIPSLEAYYDYFLAHKKTEGEALVSILTTHHTFFFREFLQFEYLEVRLLAGLLADVMKRPDKKLRIWSAACSRGHEVYTLGMFLEPLLKRLAPQVTYEIFGTDIDKESVEFAKNGVYTRNETKEIPLVYMGEYWARGTGEIANFTKVKNILRSKTTWDSFNLLELPSNFKAKFDIIFCRNVFIYFNSTQIKQISEKLLNHLEPHGYLFIGISETLNGLNLPVQTDGRSIYSHKRLVPNKPSEAKPMPRQTGPVVEMKETLRVLCVDDSPSILTMLKKVLSVQDGFEIVGTATNGLDAAEKMKLLKPDLMTLDIHMPEQTGLEYLKKNYNLSHCPVVIVSSVAREDSALASQVLHSGASDYVEKPALSNMNEVGDELKQKLRCAYRNSLESHKKLDLRLDDSFVKPLMLKYPEKFVRVIIARLGDKARVDRLIREFNKPSPPILILLDGAPDNWPETSNTFKCFPKLLDPSTLQELKPDAVYLGSIKAMGSSYLTPTQDRPASIMIFADVGAKAIEISKTWRKYQILLEDIGKKSGSHPFYSLASDVVPMTSFSYMSDEFLGRPLK